MRKILPVINLLLAALLVYILIKPQLEARKVVQAKILYERNIAALPVFVAYELGYFDSLRVKVTLQEVSKVGEEVDMVGKGSAQIGAGLSGDLFVFKTGPRPDAFRLAYTSSSTEAAPATALFVKRPPKRRRRRARIKGLKDLVGKRIGFPRYTRMDDILKLLIRREEADPERFRLVPLSVFEMDSALQKGFVDALVAVEPYRSLLLNQPETIQLIQDGFLEKSAVSPFLLGVGFTSNVNINLQKNATERLIKALDMAVKFIRTRPDSAVTIANTALLVPLGLVTLEDLSFLLPNYANHKEIEMPALIRWISFLKEANILLFDVDADLYIFKAQEIP